MVKPKMVLKKGFFQKVLFFLEDQEHPTLGPNLKFLRFIGLWRPVKSRTTYIKAIIFILSTSFFITQYLKCLINRDLHLLKLIIMFMPFHVGVSKSCFFLSQHKHWVKLIQYTSSLERRQLSNDNEKVHEIINNYRDKIRRMTYLFWSLALLCNTSLFTEPYRKTVHYENGTVAYTHMYEWYNPFKDTRTGFSISMIIETILGNVMSSYVVGWDSFIFSVMIFFAGQLEVVRVYCSEIATGSSQETHHRIVDCHQFYMELIKYQKLCKSLISPVMFINLVVITVFFGLVIIKTAQTKNDFTALINNLVFIASILVQLLVFYWHGNEVTEQSKLVSYGVFESDWVNCDKKTQNEVAMLAVSTSKRLIFTAGPYNEMTLATFINILRVSYSFYTILNETN